jgi:Fur family peroxide stress response transcriptional regulator
MQIRSTYQKKIIYDYIVKSKSHPSINQIHQDLLVNGENIGIATCYRNLKSLVNEGKVIQIMTSDNIAHFDYVKHNHYHLVCKNCHHIKDMDAETISINDDESILNNFKADINNLVIYGVCKKCQEKEKN